MSSLNGSNLETRPFLGFLLINSCTDWLIIVVLSAKLRLNKVNYSLNIGLFKVKIKPFKVYFKVALWFT